MTTYAVTYCLMDEETGSSHFWHACLILSKYNADTKKWEVVDQWGFYGLPPSQDNPKTFTSWLKTKMRLDLDLENHGVWKHEETRYFDSGCGTHGITIPLSTSKFNELQKKCEATAAEQFKAIEEIATLLKLQPKAANKTRIYKYENDSRLIYETEKKLAQQENRPPRLNAFGFGLSSDANTCKAQALKLLDGIITPQQLKGLKGLIPTIPRTSGPGIHKIFLHSTGPTQQHTKKSGKKVYFRDYNDKQVKIYWTLPPQDIESFRIPQNYRDKVELVIRRLQKLEWFLMNATLPEEFSAVRDRLIDLVIKHYEVFSLITPKAPSAAAATQEVKETTSVSDRLFNYFFPPSFLPRNNDEQKIQKQIQQATELLECFYHTLVDKWEIVELSEPEEAEEKNDNTNLDYLKGFLNALPLDEKKELCAIFDKGYAEYPEIDYSENSSRLAYTH